MFLFKREQEGEGNSSDYLDRTKSSYIQLECFERFSNGFNHRGANHSQKRCTRLLITRDYFVIKVIILWLMGLFCDYFVIIVWLFCDYFVIILWLFDYFAIIWLFCDYFVIILWLFWKVYEIINQWFAPRFRGGYLGNMWSFIVFSCDQLFRLRPWLCFRIAKRPESSDAPWSEPLLSACIVIVNSFVSSTLLCSLFWDAFHTLFEKRIRMIRHNYLCGRSKLLLFVS